VQGLLVRKKLLAQAAPGDIEQLVTLMRPELSHNRDMVTLDTLRAERREEILRLAERRGAHGLRVFGSVARGEANENSDLDLLVAWEPGRSLLDHAGLVEDLQELLGMRVHVGTEKSLHWYVRDRILREATPL
jgi:hypothetical protein